MNARHRNAPVASPQARRFCSGDTSPHRAGRAPTDHLFFHQATKIDRTFSAFLRVDKDGYVQMTSRDSPRALRAKHISGAPAFPFRHASRPESVTTRGFSASGTSPNTPSTAVPYRASIRRIPGKLSSDRLSQFVIGRAEHLNRNIPTLHVAYPQFIASDA